MYTAYISYLLRKKERQEEALTAEEQQILDRWYETLQLDTRPGEEAMAEAKRQAWQTLVQQLPQSAAPVISLEERKRPASRRWAYWAAAVLILVLASVGVYEAFLKPADRAALAFTTIQTGEKEKKIINLPDGSVVWVNAQSKIRFNADFQKDRKLFLDYGEAFFEVKRDTLHPFEVNTDNIYVKVLGTAFNVQSYASLDEIKVTVDHGRVRVTDSVQNSIVTDNQEWVYHKKNGQARLRNINEDERNNWQSGNVYLSNATLKELAVYIENIYGYTMVFRDKSLEDCSNTINFNEKDDISSVLEVLRIINHVQYRIEGKTIYLSGPGCKPTNP